MNKPLTKIEILNGLYFGQRPVTELAMKAMDAYATQAVKYALHVAAEKAKVVVMGEEGEYSRDTIYALSYDEIATVDRKSFLNLEEQILKDLGI